MNDQENRAPNRPVSISTAEFDRKVEAGGDIDMHLDWGNAISIEPGELSPEQKLAVARGEGWQTSNPHQKIAESLTSLNVFLPQWAFDQLQNDARRQGIRQDELAQLLILQRLDKQRSVA